MSSSDSKYSELWVCFEPPSVEIPPNVIVLSFMSPEKEVDYKRLLGERFINGRNITQLIREKARETYTSLIAEMASTSCIFGKTLRQALKGNDGVSRWWYLRVSSKDSVQINSPYTPILRLYSVKFVANKWNIKDIRLFGAPCNFFLCLKKSFRIYLHQSENKRKFYLRSFLFCKFPLFYGLANRVVFAVKEFYKLLILKEVPYLFNDKLEVALQGSWDWSFNSSTNPELVDVYFADLPKRLRAGGYSVGWFCFLDYSKKGYSYKRMISESMNYPEVILIERYLSTIDLLRSAIKIQYSVVLFAFLLSRKFRSLFIRDGLNLYPLFRSHIISSITGKDIPYHELISLAIRRACNDLKPKIVLTFQELFPLNRAFYAGARQAMYPLKIFTAQHAGYGSDKTIGTLVRDIELNGQPDGCKMPLPDKIFVMGELSQRIFLKNGFSDDQIMLSGGLRYQHVKIKNKTYKKNSSEALTLLLIGSMNEHLDMDMCEAVYTATAEMPFVRLRLREHPYYKFTHLDGFQRFKARFEVSECTREADLVDADLVMFTYSSLAEEALLMGIPVWQWQWAGFNASIFLNLPIIPVFYSVEELKESIKKFINNPERYYPYEEVKRMVLNECFGPFPERASEVVFIDLAKQLKRLIL